MFFCFLLFDFKLILFFCLFYLFLWLIHWSICFLYESLLRRKKINIVRFLVTVMLYRFLLSIFLFLYCSDMFYQYYLIFFLYLHRNPSAKWTHNLWSPTLFSTPTRWSITLARQCYICLSHALYTLIPMINTIY